MGEIPFFYKRLEAFFKLSYWSCCFSCVVGAAVDVDVVVVVDDVVVVVVAVDVVVFDVVDSSIAIAAFVASINFGAYSPCDKNVLGH